MQRLGTDLFQTDSSNKYYHSPYSANDLHNICHVRHAVVGNLDLG